ncbi:hypothetical protein BD779DRAFT_1675417 [Infundibulicybe gibba]|nr:hypothetical protein BD779DRAFT_1675417 [Infundibulicybe gibba]
MTLAPQAAMALGTVLEGILYGVYIVLFVLYLVLRRRRSNSHSVDGPLTLAQILLFCLCTTSLCLDISAEYFLVIMQDANAADRIALGWLVIFLTIDFLAQMILLYRCWIIWNRRWVVVVAPGLLALVTLGQGFAYVGLTKPSPQSTDTWILSHFMKTIGITAYSISLGVSALTTSLIVTRILLTSWQVRPMLGSNSHRSLRIAAAMLIESGLLMFAFQLAFVVLLSSGSIMFNIVSCPTAQIYGITPMLLNIRVMMGAAHVKTTEKMASLRFAHSGGAATRTTGQSTRTAGVQSQGIDTESDDGSSNERAIDDAV